jgi:hypothetical protein
VSARLGLTLALLVSQPAAGPLTAQFEPGPGGIQRSAEAAAYRLNYAIPDAPAFELLQVEPGSILRPQSARELGLAVASFVNEDGSITLPRAFAVEFSPGLLTAQEHLTLRDYTRARFLYRLRVSAAALRDSAGDGPTRVALGLRFTLADEADLRTDTAYAKGQQVTELTGQILAVYTEARRRVGPTADLALTPDEEEQIAAINDEIRRRWAERYWNADVTDVAIAARLAAVDSTGAGVRTDAFSLWGTLAKGVGHWGQLLVGLRAGAERAEGEDSYRGSGSIASRFYGGSNRLKGYAEIQGSLQEDSKADFLFTSGLEFGPAPWLWADFSAGLESPGGAPRSRLVTRFKVKSGVPGW